MVFRLHLFLGHLRFSFDFYAKNLWVSRNTIPQYHLVRNTIFTILRVFRKTIFDGCPQYPSCSLQAFSASVSTRRTT